MAEHVETVPSVNVQKQIISGLIGKTMVKGQTWYLIDNCWFKNFKRYVGMDEMWDGTGTTGEHPGPIDNSPLYADEARGILRSTLIDDLDYFLVPDEAWDFLMKWYGLKSERTAIARQVIEYGLFVKHAKVEVYLLSLRLCKDFKLENEVSRRFSKGDTIGDIERVMRDIYHIPDNEEVRMWCCFTETTFEQLNKSETTVQDAGLCPNQMVIIETHTPEGSWIRHTKKACGVYATSTNTSTATVTSTSSAPVLSATPDKSSAPGPSSIMATRFNPYNYPTDARAAPGLCGLCNLGNTCFMNSVLQCMSNCPPITKYFLKDEHLNELNEDNPLGMNGEIAKAFGDLIKVMWSGKHSYTMPHNFKLQVGRFAPQFSGYQQHDSQELLTFLLDGLHEDLNRIKKKPYIELQDSLGRPDKEVAKESWDNYRKRNDSIIVDFFHGLLKSTVVCPDCNKVSITFDPFCYLSLPLPTKKERAVEILLFHHDPQLKPTHYTVIVPKKGLIKDLVTNVGRLCGVPTDQLLVTEVTGSHFHKFFDSNDSLDKIDDKEIIYVFEMPAHNETQLVMPVYMWEAGGKEVFSHELLFGDPFLIVIPRKGCTYDILYQLLIRKLSRYVQLPDDNSSWWCPLRTISNVGFSRTTEEIPPGEYEKNCSDGECNDANRRKLFSLYLVTPTPEGTVEADKLHNDGNPLQLPKSVAGSFIALRWSHEARKLFFIETSLMDTEDQSMKNNLQALKLKDCIDLYITREKLGAGDAWYCPTCKKHQQATKKFDLWSLPIILIIHLKRFVYNRYRREKVDRSVTYPVRGLNMSEYIISQNHPDAVYDLIGVCNHFGGMGGGHYTAFCKNQNDQKWYLFDDNSVSEISEHSVVTNSAYVLFYKRRNSYDEQMELN